MKERANNGRKDMTLAFKSIKIMFDFMTSMALSDCTESLTP